MRCPSTSINPCSLEALSTLFTLSRLAATQVANSLCDNGNSISMASFCTP